MVGQGSQPQKKRDPMEVFIDLSNLYTCKNMQARVNIPGISSRTIRQDASAAKVTTSAEIQVGCIYITNYTVINDI